GDPGLRPHRGARLRPGHRRRYPGGDPGRSGGRRRLPRYRGGGRVVSALLEVEGLTAGYDGVPVLHGVDLRVPAGTSCAVLGANGAGKTTLLRALSGLVQPSAGRILFDGADLADLPTERLVHRGIGHVPEGRGVIAELSVEENLMLGGAWRLDWAGVWGAGRI